MYNSCQYCISLGLVSYQNCTFAGKKSGTLISNCEINPYAFRDVLRMYGQALQKLLCVWKKGETGRSLAQGAIRNGVGGSCGPSWYTSCVNSRPPHNPMNSKAPHLLNAGESSVRVGLRHQFKKSLEFFDCFNVLISWALFLCRLWFSTFAFILCHCCEGQSIPELNGSLVQLLWGEKEQSKQNKTKYPFFFLLFFKFKGIQKIVSFAFDQDHINMISVYCVCIIENSRKLISDCMELEKIKPFLLGRVLQTHKVGAMDAALGIHDVFGKILRRNLHCFLGKFLNTSGSEMHENYFQLMNTVWT